MLLPDPSTPLSLNMTLIRPRHHHFGIVIGFAPKQSFGTERARIQIYSHFARWREMFRIPQSQTSTPRRAYDRKVRITLAGFPTANE
jgi:hypothetical protein